MTVRQSKILRVILFCAGALFLLINPLPFARGAAEEGLSSAASLQKAQAAMAAFERELTLSEKKELDRTAWTERDHLVPRMRRFKERKEVLRKEVVFWEEVMRLKKDILSLPGIEGRPVDLRAREEEADQMARKAIEGFVTLREQYQMIRPAVLHNVFVNTGMREEGFCWHWARDLRKRLMPLGLKQFDLLWATAYDGRLREHNTLVITPAGGGLRDGLLLDGWRKSGKPFWIRVAKDHFPWKPGEYAGD